MNQVGENPAANSTKWPHRPSQHVVDEKERHTYGRDDQVRGGQTGDEEISAGVHRAVKQDHEDDEGIAQCPNQDSHNINQRHGDHDGQRIAIGSGRACWKDRGIVG